jgi:hypothetical protein
MIRESEDALIKERSNLQRTKTQKNDRYNTLMNQVRGVWDLNKIISFIFSD